MKLVGLTGGIASGKSTVAKLFTQLGAKVIDADQVSRDICEPGRPAIEILRDEFSDSVIDQNGGLDRIAMREIVFNDREKLRKLESILHPLIYQEIATWLAGCVESGAKVAIMEATLIIEAPPPVPLDCLIVVTCKESTRIQRIKNRDGFDEEHIRKVMANQLHDSERVKHADYVIENDGDLEETREKVIAVWNDLISENPAD